MTDLFCKRALRADKGYDSAENKRALYDDNGIKPIIDNRTLWRDEHGKPRQLFPDRADTILYDELGQLYCQCPSERRGEDKIRELAFVGYEKDRRTLKFRCPAAAYDLDCPGRALCEAGTRVGSFGRVVRVPLSFNRRIFTPIARCSQKWEKAYRLRTSVERVNSRVDRLGRRAPHDPRPQQDEDAHGSWTRRHARDGPRSDPRRPT